jgi:pimeloyl-ACP methyl ester carboxylesterase
MAVRPIGLLIAVWVAACDGGPTQPSPVALGFGPVVEFPNRREVEVGFQGPDGAVLSGTLILPPSPGRYPAIVMHFGSNRWTRATFDGSDLAFWTENGIAVLTYDKRGVGKSQGICCPWKDPGYFPLLGGDVASAVRLAGTHPEIDQNGVGAWGFSQGGWVVPAAAAALGDRLAFVIIGSGPTVTLGEELLYSALTGDNECRPSGLAPEEIERRLDAAGPSGFDPRPDLRAMSAPGLWIYGGLDTSIPVARSVGILRAIADDFDKDFTSVVLARLNHSWILDGAMCQTTGPGGIDGRLIHDWLAPRLAARAVIRGH